jgi:hypothetical protein
VPGHLLPAGNRGRSQIAGEADQVGKTRQHKPKDQRLVGHGTLRKKSHSRIDPGHRSKESASGNRCAEHERSRVKSPKLYFSADSSLVYRAESDSRPVPVPAESPNRAGRVVACLSFSGELRASAQDSRMRISGKVSGEGVDCPPYLVVYPTERGCHGEESQEGEEGEEGSQEEVIRAFDFMARAQMPEPSLFCFGFLGGRMSFSENRCPPRIKCGAGFFRDMR